MMQSANLLLLDTQATPFSLEETFIGEVQQAGGARHDEPTESLINSTLYRADLLHLRKIERMSAGVLSIGGAGVFDGIALCGLFALLLS
ncbi:MAG: hypothetical protein RLZZ574_2685 [Cyanobacteriota bacterium]|jgi:hypothetical protein